MLLPSDLRNIVDKVALVFLRVKLCQTNRCAKFKAAAVSECLQWSGGTSATCSVSPSRGPLPLDPGPDASLAL